MTCDFPGAPDNIKATAQGRYLVGLPLVDHPDDQVRVFFKLKSAPILARGIARAMTLVQLAVEFADLIMPSDHLKLAAHHIGHTAVLG